MHASLRRASFNCNNTSSSQLRLNIQFNNTLKNYISLVQARQRRKRTLSNSLQLAVTMLEETRERIRLMQANDICHHADSYNLLQ